MRHNIFYLFHIAYYHRSESKISAKSSKDIAKKEAIRLSEIINNQVKDKIKNYGKIHLSPNSVGGGYEKVVCHLLSDYFGSRFEFYTRAQIVDAKMQYMKVLPLGSGEIDVVGIFNTTTPKIVLKLDEDQVMLPYDAVALLSS